ncbi:MAG: aminopeptidase P family protein [Deltaproteobacteria bacterium]|nr:aminopeptidase P family protein [Deltaproteobacteria bacterium]
MGSRTLLPVLYRNRLARLQKLLKAHNLSALLVTTPENRRYLSGFRAVDPQLSESSGFLIVGDQTTILGTDPRYEIEAHEEARGFFPFIYDRGLEGSWDKIAEKINGLKRLGFEPGGLTCQFHGRLKKILKKSGSRLELVPAADLVESLRVRKDPGEIRSIRKALAITEEVFREINRSLKPGQTERAIGWKIKTLIHQKGGDGIAFEPIVASGPNAGRPHAELTDRPIEKGESIIFDFGARWNGYCSDLSRTVCLGKPPDRFRELYGLVRGAQLAAQTGIRAGMTSQEADQLARGVIEKACYGRLFKHSLGHGVGLATHEAPSLSPVRPVSLETGMVVTIEPGLYIPDWGGIRLENMVAIGKGRSELLNTDQSFYEF